MSYNNELIVFQQLQKALDVVGQQCLEWKKAIATSGQIMESLHNICEAYHSALAVNISETPLCIYPDLDKLVQMKKISAMSSKLEAITLAMSSMKHLCDNIEKQWTAALAIVNGEHNLPGGVTAIGASPYYSAIIQCMLLLEQISKQLFRDYATRLFYVQSISTTETDIDQLSCIVTVWKNTQVLDSLLTEMSFYQHAG